MNLKTNLEEDRRLIASAKKNRRAFGAIYDKYFERIYLFVFKRLGDRDLAGDVTQEAMLKAMYGIHKYQDRGYQLSAWLFRIASNEVNLYFRRAKKTIKVKVDENQLNAVLVDFEVEGEEKEQRKLQELIKALANLTPEQSEIIELRYFSGFSFQEIAEFYEISEATAKMRLYRLLEKMKKTLFNQ